ncbi:MAG: hypothetical protein MHMPM18_000601 [Marteilia pararefringens]
MATESPLDDTGANLPQAPPQPAAAAAVHWSNYDDLILLHQANRALSIGEISKGSYSKGLESLCDNVATLANRNENIVDLQKTVTDSQNRLKFLIHKVPKHRTLDQLLTLCESNIYKQYFNGSQKRFKTTSLACIEPQLFKNLLDWFIDEKIKAKKRKRAKYEIDNLKSKYFYRFLNFKSEDILRINNAYQYAINDRQLPIDNIAKVNSPEIISQSDASRTLVSDSQDSNKLDGIGESLNTYFSQSNLSTKTKKKTILLPGEPRMPPSNTYALFTKLSFKNMKPDAGSTDRLSRVSEEWRRCGKEVRDQLADELLRMNKEYMQKLAEFYITINDENIREIFEKKHKSRLNSLQKVVEEVLNNSKNVQ